MIERQRLNLRNKFLQLINDCKDIRQLKQIQCQIIKAPSFTQKDHSFLTNRLLFFSALSNLGSLSYATTLFHSINNPSLSAYNIIIRAYAGTVISTDGTHLRPSLNLYKKMLCDGIRPDCLTFPFLLKECTRRADIEEGSSVHAQVIKYGFHYDPFVQNSLIGLYCACGCLRHARDVFEEMPNRDIVSWNSIIVGYLRCGELDEALGLFRRIKERNIITWNSIITGFVQGGRPKEALAFFYEMQSLDTDMVKPDKITIASALSACANLGAVDQGRWLHTYLRRSGLECDVVIGTALVDMYGKCGLVEKAYEVFKEMPKKDILTWTAMISVFALHGCGKETLNLLKEMESQGLRPNHVTFVGLLSACAHSGLVEEGRWCFEMMRHVYSIEPQVYHYACMVDILGRAGLFDEAEDLIRSMPMDPDVFVWGALLGGCQMYGNVELGVKVAQYLINLEPTNHAFYVNLCDVYAKASRYDDVKRVRSLMKEKGIEKKLPGCSMIEVQGVVHEFSVNGSYELVSGELVPILEGLFKEMTVEGSMSDICELPVGSLI